MRFLNSVIVLLIVVIYTLAFTIRPLGATALAGVGAETEDMAETETECPYTPDEFYEMSHVISAEAGNCTWEMMAGVGYVVMNRVKAKCWPNTVYEVIHQPGQYTCVDNGDFYKDPTPMACEVADYVLRNGSEYPENVVYQATVPLGSGEYTRESCAGFNDMIYSYGRIE